MRRILGALAILVALFVAGFDVPRDLGALIRRAESIEQKIERLQTSKSRLEAKLEKLASEIERMKAKGAGPIGRARLERLLAEASEISDQLEAMELKLRRAQQQRDELGVRIAEECERRMSVEAQAVRTATTDEQAKEALEAYLNYRNIRDRWAPRTRTETTEFLIPDIEPDDSVQELRLKLDLVGDLLDALEKLKAEMQRKREALVRERELEREILQRAELRRLFEEGEIETFGSKPSLADLKRLDEEINRLDEWLAYLDEVQSELLDARDRMAERIKSLEGSGS